MFVFGQPGVGVVSKHLYRYVLLKRFLALRWQFALIGHVVTGKRVVGCTAQTNVHVEHALLALLFATSDTISQCTRIALHASIDGGLCGIAGVEQSLFVPTSVVIGLKRFGGTSALRHDRT